jgi:hypothetical protein
MTGIQHLTSPFADRAGKVSLEASAAEVTGQHD